MSLLNPAATTTNTIPSPLFELRGFASNFSLAAIISGAVLAIGVSRIGTDNIVVDLHAGGFGLYLIVAAYLAFTAMSYLTGGHNSSRTDGIYKFTRNPGHLAFFLPLASLSYFSVETAIASIVVYVTAMNLTVIRTEERDMQKAYGASYTEYRKAVPRWFA
jgi:protein-S-isoprenylcysteine O-methyltransferase Ste14